MRYREFQSAPPLSKHVECIRLPEGADRRESAAPERILPDGCVELIRMNPCHLAFCFLRLDFFLFHLSAGRPVTRYGLRCGQHAVIEIMIAETQILMMKNLNGVIPKSI